MKRRLSATIHREGAWFVSWCPELDVASQGRTVEEALANLREALELYLESAEAALPEGPFLLTTVEVEDAQAPPLERSRVARGSAHHAAPAANAYGLAEVPHGC